MATALLYRTVGHNGGLVFALEEEAQRVAGIHEAISKARTWEEFRSLVPNEVYSEIVDAIEAGGPPPRDEDEFSGEQIPGWNDGDYPPWLQQEMSDLIPTDVPKTYGELLHTAINGSYWHLPPEREIEIVAALKAHGFVVTKADTLRFH